MNAKIAKGSKRGLNAEGAKVTQRAQRRGGAAEEEDGVGVRRWMGKESRGEKDGDRDDCGGGAVGGIVV